MINERGRLFSREWTPIDANEDAEGNGEVEGEKRKGRKTRRRKEGGVILSDSRVFASLALCVFFFSKNARTCLTRGEPELLFVFRSAGLPETSKRRIA